MDVSVWGFVIAALGGAIGVLGWLRNRGHDSKNDGRESGQILTEIGYIKSGIDDIKRKQALSDQRHVETVGRLSAVEASAKQAHKRLDRIEGNSRPD